MEVSKAADSKMMIFFTLFEPQLPSNGWLICIYIYHIHNMQVNLFVHNSFIKCMCVW
jgi:hypothetical protein